MERRNSSCPLCGYRIDRVGCCQGNTVFDEPKNKHNGQIVHTHCYEAYLVSQENLQRRIDVDRKLGKIILK